MADPLCSPGDVAETLGVDPYEEPEYSQVGRLCRVVSGLIRSRRRLVDTWLAQGLLDADLVNGIAVQVVMRVMTTVSTGGVGLRSETHPEYSYELTASAAAGLNLTKAELAALTPDVGRSRPFSVMPT
jgi:hypothetical protein